MEIQPDFRELLRLFNGKQVDYRIVGAYALAFFGVPRFTGDLDILVRPDPQNARRILDALTAFGFGDVGLSEADFLDADRMVQLGVPPVRITLLTALNGVSADEAFRSPEVGRFGGLLVKVIGKAAFIQNKRAMGRQRDLADLESLDAL